jgi:hypothetical protein
MFNIKYKTWVVLKSINLYSLTSASVTYGNCRDKLNKEENSLVSTSASVPEIQITGFL